MYHYVEDNGKPPHNKSLENTPCIIAHKSAQAKFEHWSYTMYAISTNNFEPLWTPLLLRTHLRCRAEFNMAAPYIS